MSSSKLLVGLLGIPFAFSSLGCCGAFSPSKPPAPTAAEPSRPAAVAQADPPLDKKPPPAGQDSAKKPIEKGPTLPVFAKSDLANKELAWDQDDFGGKKGTLHGPRNDNVQFKVFKVVSPEEAVIEGRIKLVVNGTPTTSPPRRVLLTQLDTSGMFSGQDLRLTDLYEVAGFRDVGTEHLEVLRRVGIVDPNK